MKSAPSGKRLSRNTCPIVQSQRRRKHEHASIRTWIPSCWTIQTFKSSITSFVQKSTSASSYWTQRFSTKYLSLSRLNHRLPRSQTDPEVMQGTTEFHYEIADTVSFHSRIRSLTTRQRLT